MTARESIPRGEGVWSATGWWRQQSVLSASLALAAASLLALWPILHHGFLVVAFDDDAFILDNPYTHALTWQNVWACLTRFYLYDYLPLPMLSYLVEYPFWGLAPAGYHAVNLILHITASVLVFRLAAQLLGRRAGWFAGLLFALHPVQVGPVAVIAQRKTLLATLFVVAALLAYHRYRQGSRAAFPLAVLLYLGACASKSSVVTFPLLLIAYDFWFHRQSIQPAATLPFFALAAGTVALSMASKLGTEVVKGPHGGSYLVNWLAMSRVLWEYLAALVLPLNLSPSYYYHRRAALGVLNWVAAAGLVVVVASTLRWRLRYPLTAFFLTWFFVSLLPVSNLIPIAVLRNDAYLYLPMVGFAMWGGAVLARAGGPSARRWLRPLPYVVIVLLAVLARGYTDVWRNDVTAWTRVLDRHPDAGKAHYMLAAAYARRNDPEPARRLAMRAVELDPSLDVARTLLADLDRPPGSSPLPGAGTETR
jgi:hypothetical protein